MAEVEVVCDSSSLIALSETCNTSVLGFLKEKGARFFITPHVEKEIIAHPRQLKQYALSALRLNKLLQDKVLETIELSKAEARHVMEQANALFSVNGHAVKILHEGEAECLAALKRGNPRVFLIDEKTTRLLVESPKTLLESLRTEYAGKIVLNNVALNALRKGLEKKIVLRSTELLAIAFSKGFFQEFEGERANVFHSALYALQSAGCSITSRELEEYEKTIV